MEEDKKEILYEDELEDIDDEKKVHPLDSDYFIMDSKEEKEENEVESPSEMEESNTIKPIPEVGERNTVEPIPEMNPATDFSPVREERDFSFRPTQTPSYSKEPKKRKKINSTLFGFAVGIMVFIVLMAIFYATGILSFEEQQEGEEKVFYGETYSIKYKAPWKETTKQKTNGEEGKILSYKDKILFLPLGSSPLDETTEADFSKIEGKKQLYNEFYSYWGESDYLGEGTDGFKVLVDGIYYATMDYGTSEGTVDGKFYLIVSESDNIILSFTTYVKGNKTSADKEVMKLLENLHIGTKYDDEMASYLDNMSNWNRYESVRQGELGTKKTIEGGWRILEDNETYWSLKNNEFTLYESYKELNDNYVSGTYEQYIGKEGTTKVGISTDKIDEIVAKSSGTVKEEDIYTLILKPTKKIAGGQDSTQELTSEEWNIVWILVDHGAEGIEAQQLNVKTSSTAFYVKIKDE